MDQLPVTMFLNELYKALILFLSEEGELLPTTIPLHRLREPTSIEIVAYRHYPSFFENHGAKAPYLDFIKLNQHSSRD
jgi:hypothetical protein